MCYFYAIMFDLPLLSKVYTQMRVNGYFNALFLVPLSCPNFTRKTRNAPSRTMPSSTRSFKL